MIGAAHLPLAAAATQEAAVVNRPLSPADPGLRALANAPRSATGLQSSTLPLLADFETGGVDAWFTYGDWGGGSVLDKSVAVTNTLAALGAAQNSVMKVAYTARGWGVGVGLDTVPYQDWSAYDGLGFWFYGTNTGTVFKIILTDNDGERLATQFTDNFTGWRELTFPWQVFYHDPDWQPDGAPHDGPTLTAVQAFAFAPLVNSQGVYYMDYIKLFKTTGAVVSDFQTGGVDAWFTYGDWDNGSVLGKSVVVTNTLAALGAAQNSVMKVEYTARGWGVGVGLDTIPYQDWSAYDGLGFWFYGTNTGTVFKIILTDNDGERLATKFTDNFTGWRELTFPWQVFYHDPDWQPDGAPNDGPTLTAVQAFAFAPAVPGQGVYYMDCIKLFKTTGAVVSDFQTGGVDAWFTYGDWDNGSVLGKSVMVTNTLAALGAAQNSVMKVAYTARGWGVGVGLDTVPYQDWSAYDGLGFWFYGTNTGTVFKIILTDNDGERLATKFTDNFSGWRELTFPWQVFYHDPDWQPDGAPNDGPTLTAVQAFAFSPAVPGQGVYYMDYIKLFGPASLQIPISVDFASAAYTVDQGKTANIAVTLNATPATTVTVDYETSDGTAVAGVDYIAASGTLTFAPGVTEQVFSVSTITPTLYAPNKTVTLSLSNAAGAKLGALHNPAVLTLLNTTPPPSIALIEDFESGLPTGRDPFGNQIGFSIWGSTYGNVGITLTTGTTGTVILPGGSAPNTTLKITSNVESWGGFTDAFKDENAWGSQDWSRYDGLRFWFYGANSGSQIQVEIFDNRQLGNTGDSAERFYQRFTDNFSGWKHISLPFALFQRRTDYQPSGAPADGLNLTDVSGFAFNLPAVSATTVYYLDQVELYGDLAQHPATVRAGFAAYAYAANEGQSAAVKVTLNTTATLPVTVTCVLTDDSALLGIDYLGPVERTLVFAPGTTAQTFTVTTFANSKVAPRRSLDMTLTQAVGAAVGYRAASPLVIMDTSISDPSMIDDFEYGLPATLKPGGNVTVSLTSVLSGTALALPGQELLNTVLSVTYSLPAGLTAGAHAVANAGGFTRTFPISQDWSAYNGLAFWVYGMNTGTPITVQLLDNRQPEPGPDGWKLVWSDEFTGAAGSAPNPANWNYDIGGGGWGNNEWEYYTDSRDNSALDGNGHLVITATTNTDPALTCASSPTGPNGMCYATSARLLTSGKQEFLYGRLEASIKIPKGQGLWPAFWMLGNDIGTVGWPASGEIDIMENIGKPSEQNIIYGTIHGPGYSGGSNIGSGPYALPSPLSDDFHVFAIEWEPTEIRWYVDDTNYFTATVADLPPNTDWVFDHPFFFLLNVAVGGNWPGYPDATTQFPQTMQVDYVRVSQAPDTAERFEATFVDDFSGWKRVILPFSAFTRSAEQPLDAPNDGLTLSEVWGYSLELPAGSQGAFYLDEVQLAHLNTLYLPLVFRNH